MGLMDGVFKLAKRSDRKARNNLGVISGRSATRFQSNKWRSWELEQFDAYYEGRQYDHLPEWDQASDPSEYIAVRKRRPRLPFNFPKALTNRIIPRLIGTSTFPALECADDLDTQDFIKVILQASDLQSFLNQPMRRVLVAGAHFVRFYIADQKFVLEAYAAKLCYPKFSHTGELVEISIRYVYEDKDDRDEKGQARQKWYRLDLNQVSEIVYHPVPYDPQQDPEEIPWQIAEQLDHDLGFIQGQWFRTDLSKMDGVSLIHDILDFCDDFSYSLSQSSQAVGYNQDPQLAVNGMDNEELTELVRSSQKGWNLGKDGKAAFIESNLAGVTVAGELRDKLKLSIQDITRIVFFDPDKMNMSQLSGKAMELLNGPLVELVDELRPILGKQILELVMKMAAACLMAADQGVPLPINMPQGFFPKSWNISLNWPPIFQRTMVDLKDKVSVASTAAAGNLISREAMTRWLAKDFDIKDVEEELQRIAVQAPLNPFGAF